MNPFSLAPNLEKTHFNFALKYVSPSIHEYAYTIIDDIERDKSEDILDQIKIYFVFGKFFLKIGINQCKLKWRCDSKIR